MVFFPIDSSAFADTAALAFGFRSVASSGKPRGRWAAQIGEAKAALGQRFDEDAPAGIDFSSLRAITSRRPTGAGRWE